jgi:hypothetical protein
MKVSAFQDFKNRVSAEFTTFKNDPKKYISDTYNSATDKVSDKVSDFVTETSHYTANNPAKVAALFKHCLVAIIITATFIAAAGLSAGSLPVIANAIVIGFLAYDTSKAFSDIEKRFKDNAQSVTPFALLLMESITKKTDVLGLPFRFFNTIQLQDN